MKLFRFLASCLIITVLMGLTPIFVLAQNGAVILAESFNYADGTKLNTTTASGNWTSGWVADTLSTPTALSDGYVVNGGIASTNVDTFNMFRLDNGQNMQMNGDYDFFIKWDEYINTNSTNGGNGAELSFIGNNNNMQMGLAAVSATSIGQYIPILKIPGAAANATNTNIVCDNDKFYTLVGRVSSRLVSGTTYSATNSLMVYESGTAQPSNWQLQNTSTGVSGWWFKGLRFSGRGYSKVNSIKFKGVTLEKYTKAEINPIETAISTAVSTRQYTDIIAARAKIATLIDGIAKDTFTAQLNAVNVIHVPVSSALLNKQNIVFRPKSIQQLSVDIQPANATYNMKWETDNSLAVTVDDNGLVTGIADGVANITAVIKDLDDIETRVTCEVRVDSSLVVPVTGISIDSTKIVLPFGSNKKINATVFPLGANNSTVIWSSANTNVVTVDNDGNLTTVNRGITDITVKTVEGNYSAVCKVIVGEPVTGVTLNKSTIKIAGNKEKLSATILPANAEDKNVVWTSSNSSVITVSEEGVITPIKAGTAKVTVKTEDGGYTAVCDVNVSKFMIINPGGPYVGEMLTYSVAPKDENGTDIINVSAEFYCNSNNTKRLPSSNGVCYIQEKVDDISIIGNPIHVKIIYTLSGASEANSTFINEINSILAGVPVTEVTLSKSDLPLLVSQTGLLIPNIIPSNALNKNVKWKSTDDKIATVDQTGLVTMISAGSADIIVTTDNSLRTNVCKVHTPTNREAVVADKEVLELGITETTRNITLPIIGSLGTTIKWVSNSAEINSLGEVIRPLYQDGDKDVTLTATISKGSEKVTKDFVVRVKRLQDSPSQNIIYTARETFSLGDISGVISNITLPNKTGTNNDISIVWSSSDESIISTTGMVNRPAWLTRADAKINLIAKMTYDGVVTSKLFTVTVIRLAPTDAERPTARYVAISNNGDLTGSYVYNAPEGEAEGQSIYKWYADGTLVSGETTKIFSGSASYSGKSIVFEVTPVTASGLSGAPVRSTSVYIDGKSSSNVITSSRGGGGGVVVPPTPEKKLPFGDIADDHWAKKDIEQMWKKGYIKGISEQSFAPEQSITRAEFITLMVKILGIETVKYKDSFKDVQSGDWYSDSIQTATDNGIVSGSDGNIRPNDTITRQEISKIIVEAYKSKKGDIAITDDALLFDDADQIAKWAVEYIKLAKDLGIIKGTSERSFSPQMNTTRAQATVIIKRLLDKIS